ncbi:MAG: conjugal transfer protein TraG N-terminal domain-containing protein [Betaproteobacteria bacterium]|nr:conjugal transfer protein TraG N-terminal domain-containing protein [Betaproteobacteria bacterium]
MYEIYSYGNNDALFGIFNAVAALVGANGYTGALAITVTAGFITALLAYAFAPDKLNGWKWLAGVVLIYSVLLVPRVNVGIVDKLGNQPVKVVANVPLGLGLLGHFTNVVGNTLTELFETALQVIPGDGALPLELSYQQHGLMFGTRLVKETRSVVFLDPAFRTDLINFVHNCTMFDLADGTVDPKAFATSVDVWTLMGNPNPARFSTLTTNGNVDVQPCPGVYVNLSARMPTAIDRLREHLAYALNVGLDPANAVAAINAEIETAYIKNKLANAGVAAADILRQNALINAIGDTSQIIGQKLNDPAALLLGAARAQSSASTNLWYIASGRMAEQALPLVRNVLEALIYALFPLVLLLVMLTSGRTTGMALKAYAVAFIWIQLWPPIYAIFNYMGILATAKDLAAAADLGGGLRGNGAANGCRDLHQRDLQPGGGRQPGGLHSDHRLVCAQGTGTSRAGGVQRPGRTAVGHRLRRTAGRGREHESRQPRVRSGAIGAQPQFRLHAQLHRRHRHLLREHHRSTLVPPGQSPRVQRPQHRRHAGGFGRDQREFFPPRGECDHEVQTGGHRALGRAERSPCQYHEQQHDHRIGHDAERGQDRDQHHPGANAAAGFPATCQ